jgi:hypothetical protein
VGKTRFTIGDTVAEDDLVMRLDRSAGSGAKSRLT